jgi:hypothetical protein
VDTISQQQTFIVYQFPKHRKKNDADRRNLKAEVMTLTEYVESEEDDTDGTC